MGVSVSMFPKCRRIAIRSISVVLAYYSVVFAVKFPICEELLSGPGIAELFLHKRSD